MKNILLLLILTGISNLVHAGIYEEKNTCVIVYIKEEVKKPNLLIYCDGEEMLSHYATTESERNDADEFKASLFEALISLSNERQEKTCISYDTLQTWWASCGRISP